VSIKGLTRLFLFSSILSFTGSSADSEYASSLFAGYVYN